MICKMCGRNTENENANFCEYCGNSFRENGSAITEYNSGINQTNQEVQEQDKEKTISFGNWLLSMLVPFIPFVGIFAYPVLLLVWAFSNDTPPSKKNWARASLVVILISIVLLVIFLASTMNMIMSGEFSEYMREFYNMDQFY
ncbi:hypothetical protein [Anaerocolumna sp.]|uniref:hypothetical protein n=1 Tax=Anaerocolumna sp. TaxID=2041569 RepID=UPI0028A9ECEE|nr:hypothetical protein [Anaerocolumna sp.]